MVPKHVKINDSEKEKLLKDYNVKLKQLPKILKNDPAIKELDVKPGEIIKIIRKSQTAGECMFYRVVANA